MKPKIDRVLRLLDRTFGAMRVPPKARPYELLIFANCGYPASEDACSKGWDALERAVGTEPADILAADERALVQALRAGGIVAAERAERLRFIARRVQAGADLRDRKTLKQMPTIGDPGADKILLFSRVEPAAAVPSNVLQVPLRIGIAKEQRSYAASYRAARAALDAALPKSYAARIRAYLLLKRHGQEVCKRSRPRCELCPLTRDCDYFSR